MERKPALSDARQDSHLLGVFATDQGKPSGIMVGDDHGRTTNALGLVCQHVAALGVCIICNHKACTSAFIRWRNAMTTKASLLMDCNSRCYDGVQQHWVAAKVRSGSMAWPSHPNTRDLIIDLNGPHEQEGPTLRSIWQLMSEHAVSFTLQQHRQLSPMSVARTGFQQYLLPGKTHCAAFQAAELSWSQVLHMCRGPALATLSSDLR